MDPKTHYICWIEDSQKKKRVEKQVILFDGFFLQFSWVIDYKFWYVFKNR
jgi:hypothetical protein